MATWIDNEYGSGCYCIVAKLFRVTVSWEKVSRNVEGGYRVSFGEVQLATLFNDRDEAKAAGLRLAQRKLSEALKELESDTNPASDPK